MRNLKTLLLAVLIASSSVAMANTEPTNYDEPTKICKEVTTFLEEHNLELASDVKARVTFMVNGSNEIVVMNVETKDKAVEKYIKARLNYKKLKSFAKKGTPYFLPVKVEQS